jgi:hypothetical protein
MVTTIQIGNKAHLTLTAQQTSGLRSQPAQYLSFSINESAQRARVFLWSLFSC